MNYRLIAKTIGQALFIEMLCVLLSLVVCWIYKEDPSPFMITAAVILVISLPLSRIRTKRSVYTPREGLVTVSLLWVSMALLGAIPFIVDGNFGNVVDCIFESVSGFTTTAASVLSDIEHLNRSILFWRGFTHWLGGMGVLVLALAIFPAMGKGTNNLLYNEAPGPIGNKIVPTVAGSAKSLYLLYIILTVVLIILLRVCGLPLFDSIITAFGTAGTGGCGVLNDSIIGYMNPAAEVVITVFMFLFGVNFSIFFLMLAGRWKSALNSSELKMYLVLLIGAIIAITVNIRPLYSSWGETLRYSVFQTVSFSSTTGFISADYGQWPFFSQMLLMVIMMIGTCAGSTGCGIKCARVVILLKSLIRETGKMLHPQSVRAVRMNGKNVDEDTVTTVLHYFLVYFLVIFLGGLIISLDGQGFQNTFSAIFACISNTGFGLGDVGFGGSFHIFSEPNMLLLSVFMLMGRLEIFPILMLFHPDTWKRM